MVRSFEDVFANTDRLKLVTSKNIISMKWGVEGNPLLSSILAQGLWSGTNFLVALILIRHFSLSDFGWFGFILTIRLGFIMLFAALVISPMIVIAGRYHDLRDKQSFLIKLLQPFQMLLFLVLMVGLFVAPFFPFSLFAYLMFIIGGITMEIQRRIHFILEQGHQDLFGGGFVLLVSIGGILTLANFDLLSLPRVLAWFGVTQFLWAIASGARIWLQLPRTIDFRPYQECWKIGRWDLGSTAFGFSYSQFMTFATLGFLGPTGLAVLELGRQIVAPLQVILFGAGNIYSTRLAKKVAHTPRNVLLSEIWKLTKYQTLVGIVVQLLILLSLPLLLPWLVPGKEDAYSLSITIAWILGGAMVFQLLWQNPSFGLVLFGKPNYGFYTRALVTVIIIPVGYVLTKGFGVLGAAWIRLIGECLVFLFSTFFLYRAAYGPSGIDTIFHHLTGRKPRRAD